MPKTLKYTDCLPKFMARVANLKKANSTQYLWLYEHGCNAHRHRFTRHFNCFIKQFDIQEKKGALDIEAGGLNADFDIMLSYCIKTIGENEYLYDYITKRDLDAGNYDKRLIETLIPSIKQYDRIVTHYGDAGRFDIPFIKARYLWLKARGLYEGEDFPSWGEVYQSDTYTFAKRTLKITSRRQNSIANAILGKDVKTKIDKDYWMDVKYGNKEQHMKAVEYILDHNMRDCEQLEDNYITLLPFVKESKKSL